MFSIFWVLISHTNIKDIFEFIWIITFFPLSLYGGVLMWGCPYIGVSL